MDELNAVFPKTIAPDCGAKAILVDIREIRKVVSENWNGFFVKEEEMINLYDGTKVAIVTIWTGPSLARLTEVMAQHGIEYQKAEAADKAWEAGFNLEYINGFSPVTLETFKMDGRSRVKGTKERFHEMFGASLRLYTTIYCKTFAAEDATLASLRAEGFPGGVISVSKDTTVAAFEEMVGWEFGMGVQVANADDTKLADNNLTLGEAGKA